MISDEEYLIGNLLPWVAEIHDAPTFDELNSAQASWSRAVTKYRRDEASLADLAAIASLGRARFEELAEHMVWKWQLRGELR